MSRTDAKIGSRSPPSTSSRLSSDPACRGPQAAGGQQQQLRRTSARGQDGSATVSQPQPRRIGPMIGAMLAIAALAGCGVSGNDVNRAVGAAAHAAQGATRLSEHAMRSWCPAAVADGGRQRTQAQARACLQRAWNGWLDELKRNGYDPNKVGEGK